jgi:hypothetical protein
MPEIVPWGVKRRVLKLTIPLHLVPRLRMSGAMPLLPTCALFGVGRHKFSSTLWPGIQSAWLLSVHNKKWNIPLPRREYGSSRFLLMNVSTLHHPDNVQVFTRSKFARSRSRWPRGLRRRSAAVRRLGLWVQIPPEAWMSVCCECCVSSGKGLCDEMITRPEESYRLFCVCVCV